MAVAVGAYFVVHLDDEIRSEVRRILAEHYTDLEVGIGHARLIEGRGIEIRNLSFRRRDRASGAAPMLEIDEVFLACPVQMKQLLRGLPPLERIVFQRPHLRAVLGSDGNWDVEALLPLPTSGQKPIEVVVKKGILEVAASPSTPDQRITFRELNGVLRPTERVTGAPGRHESHLEFVFAFSASGPLCRQMKLVGRFDPHRKMIRLTGDLSGLALAERDLAGLSHYLGGGFHGLRQLRGSVRLQNVELSASQAATQLAAAVELAQVEIRHTLLPDPITGLSGELTYRDGVLHAPNLTGKCGSAEFALSARRDGSSADAPWAVSARVADLDLKHRHWRVLPECLQDVWQKYQPQGLIDIARCEITSWGGRILPHIEANCRDVSILAERFRYPLRHVRGGIVLRPVEESAGAFGAVEFRLEGQAAGQTPVSMTGEFVVDLSLDGPRPQPVGWLRVAGSGLQIDETLVAALPEGPQRFVRDLRPQGRFGFVYQTQRHAPAQDEPDKQLELTLEGGTVHYRRFPYPLHDVRGKIHGRNGHWEFLGLTANSSSGSISCTGSLEPPADGASGPMLVLDFDARRLDLDSTLLQAVSVLSPDAQLVWEALNPSGRVDAKVSYRHVLGSGPPQIEHTVEPVEQSVSIKPKFFPYRIDQLEGKVDFSTSRASFEKLRGRHGPTTVVASGSFQKLGAGGWNLQLDELAVDRLLFEKELLAALPAGLARLVTRFNPRGQISLGRSSVQFNRTAADQPVTTNWRLDFDVHQASLDCGVKLDNISGGILLAGHGRGEAFTTDGELTLDSVRWNRFFASSVEGPLYADTTQVLLGQRACLARSIPPRRITADAYGGKLAGDAAVAIGPPSRFSVSAEYQAGDLRRLITETWPTRENVQGEIYGRLDLQGMSESPETIRGEGAVAVRDAELYELPQLIRLFKVLRGHEPDRTAFTQADAQFEIAGRIVGVKNLQLSGDALALHGRGTVDFDQRLNLTFYSELAPSNSAPLAGLRSLMRQASNQVMRLHVQGTIAEPQFAPEPLAGLNDALQQIQQELDPHAGPPDGQRRARNPFGRLWQ